MQAQAILSTQYMVRCYLTLPFFHSWEILILKFLVFPLGPFVHLGFPRTSLVCPSVSSLLWLQHSFYSLLVSFPQLFLSTLDSTKTMFIFLWSCQYLELKVYFLTMRSFYFMCCLFVCTSTTCVPGAQGGQQKASELPQNGVRGGFGMPDVDSRNLSPVLWNSSNCPQSLRISMALGLAFYVKEILDF